MEEKLKKTRILAKMDGHRTLEKVVINKDWVEEINEFAKEMGLNNCKFKEGDVFYILKK